MSEFDSMWNTAAASMDAAVDSMLGDKLLVQLDGLDGFVPMQGFVLPYDVSGEIDEALGTRYQVKINQSLMPYPETGHRLRHPLLGDGVFRPAGGEPRVQGRYWIFDVQRAAA